MQQKKQVLRSSKFPGRRKSPIGKKRNSPALRFGRGKGEGYPGPSGSSKDQGQARRRPAKTLEVEGLPRALQKKERIRASSKTHVGALIAAAGGKGDSRSRLRKVVDGIALGIMKVADHHLAKCLIRLHLEGKTVRRRAYIQPSGKTME